MCGACNFVKKKYDDFDNNEKILYVYEICDAIEKSLTPYKSTTSKEKAVIIYALINMLAREYVEIEPTSEHDESMVNNLNETLKDTLKQLRKKIKDINVKTLREKTPR